MSGRSTSAQTNTSQETGCMWAFERMAAEPQRGEGTGYVPPVLNENKALELIVK